MTNTKELQTTLEDDIFPALYRQAPIEIIEKLLTVCVSDINSIVKEFCYQPDKWRCYNYDILSFIDSCYTKAYKDQKAMSYYKEVLQLVLNFNFNIDRAINISNRDLYQIINKHRRLNQDKRDA